MTSCYYFVILNLFGLVYFKVEGFIGYKITVGSGNFFSVISACIYINLIDSARRNKACCKAAVLGIVDTDGSSGKSCAVNIELSEIDRIA